MTWNTTVPPERVAAVTVEFRTTGHGAVVLVVATYTTTNTSQTEVIQTGLQCATYYYIRVMCKCLFEVKKLLACNLIRATCYLIRALRSGRCDKKCRSEHLSRTCGEGLGMRLIRNVQIGNTEIGSVKIENTEIGRMEWLVPALAPRQFSP